MAEILCRNPELHHVQTHQVGSQAARDCAAHGPGAVQITPEMRTAPVPEGRTYRQVETYPISKHTREIEVTGDRATLRYRFTVEGGLSEDAAYARAESSFDAEDPGVVLTRDAEGEDWNVTATLHFRGSTLKEAQEFGDEVFHGTPAFRDLLSEVERVAAGLAERESDVRARRSTVFPAGTSARSAAGSLRDAGWRAPEGARGGYGTGDDIEDALYASSAVDGRGRLRVTGDRLHAALVGQQLSFEG